MTSNRRGAVGRRIDRHRVCVQNDHMSRKTVSLDADVYRQIKRCQTPHESISATLRRVLAEEKDPADYLDELFHDFGGTGVTTEAGLARIRARQKTPPRSVRPSHRPRAA